ncbi:MAG TPA: hypothetical protein O0Y13_05175 [Methanocorpusculum sp.]|nr:hypothetical protein [Methanocorpusculum sp.]HJK62651.1 hypothetical protein [Methanocorpusculum sp.]HJK63433.1 hypothetical protein [Methanocorpusculum sp.]HJK68441.1 hypothetical protein [Methanocorpusculum sp.]
MTDTLPLTPDQLKLLVAIGAGFALGMLSGVALMWTSLPQVFTLLGINDLVVLGCTLP